MPRKPLFNAITIILATTGLAACGGGGGGDETTTTTTTSSSKTIIGTITAFGSIYVNGIELDTSSSSYDVDDDSTADQSDLAVGMHVRVEGSVNDDGVTGTATSVYYDDDVEGPIANLTAVDATTKTFSVLGLDIRVDAVTTVFDDVTFDTLADGDEVEVSGSYDGVYIVASRIEKQTDTDQDYELKGTVDSYDGSSISLTLVNGMAAGPYDASSASSEIAVGATGVFVEIRLSDDGAGNLSVTAIEADDADSLDDNEDDVSVHGLISGDYASGFTINTTPFTVNDSTNYEPTSLEGSLAEGMEVEVEGYMQDGTLVATKVEAEHEGEDEIEIEAAVISTDTTTGSITLQMNPTQNLTIQTDNATLYEDSDNLDTDGDGSFTLSELAVGQFVEVDAYATDTDLVAVKLKREDSLDYTSLQAPLASGDYLVGESITLLDITYTLDAGTVYDPDAASISDGAAVEVKDAMPVDGIADILTVDQ